MAIRQAAIYPKWYGEVPKRSTKDPFATPIVQTPTKLVSEPPRMRKCSSEHKEDSQTLRKRINPTYLQAK